MDTEVSDGKFIRPTRDNILSVLAKAAAGQRVDPDKESRLFWCAILCAPDGDDSDGMWDLGDTPGEAAACAWIWSRDPDSLMDGKLIPECWQNSELVAPVGNATRIEPPLSAEVLEALGVFDLPAGYRFMVLAPAQALQFWVETIHGSEGYDRTRERGS